MGKLSDEEVGRIRSGKANPETLARDFKVSLQAIRDIQNYKSYNQSAAKVRERSEDIFRFAKRRRTLKTAEDLLENAKLTDEVFSAEDTKLNKLSLKRFLQNLVLFQVGNRSFYCRPGTSDFKRMQVAPR